MRRRRLPRRRKQYSLVKREETTDFRYLEQVITIQFPVRSARQYLQRQMGNNVHYKLVEAQRGETIGSVRSIEVVHANGGLRTWVHGQRVLANGEPASFFVPDHLVTIEAVVEGANKLSRNLSLEDEVILHVPVRSYLRFLPAVFQGEGPVTARQITRTRSTALQKFGSGLPDEQHVEIDIDGDAMRRFLFIFQHVMATVTDRIDRMVDLIDPLLCDPKFLPWLASWVGFEIDRSLPINQQRELVRRAIRLFRTRGTRHGIEEMVRVLTSAPVRIQERMRPKPCVLGMGATIIGGRNVVERFHRAEPPGSYLLDPDGRQDTSFFTLKLEPRERFKNRFGERAAPVLRRIVNVVSGERPTHVAFVVTFDDRR